MTRPKFREWYDEQSKLGKYPKVGYGDILSDVILNWLDAYPDFIKEYGYKP